MSTSIGGTSGITFPDASFQAGAAAPQILTLNGGVAANALTVTLSPCSLGFRSTTLSSGTVTNVAISTSISLVVPATATLGTTSAVLARLVVLALNNAGTVELAIVNPTTINLSESGLISTTAMTTASDSANVAYSSTARTNVAYRIVGYVEITEAAAGVWATDPSKVQGSGGNFAATINQSGIGYDQLWTDVTSSRAIGTTYTNNTGKPIQVVILGSTNGAAGGYVLCNINSNSVPMGNYYSAGGSYPLTGSIIVPVGATYQVAISATAGSPSYSAWFELR